MTQTSPGDLPRKRIPVLRVRDTPQRRAVIARYDEFERRTSPSVPRFLSITEFAHYFGLPGSTSLKAQVLPEPDAIIGSIKGWSRSTVDTWAAKPRSAPNECTAVGARYLSRTEVAKVLGFVSVDSMSKFPLPEPDAIIGEIKGWRLSKIEELSAARRPGRGRPAIQRVATRRAPERQHALANGNPHESPDSVSDRPAWTYLE